MPGVPGRVEPVDAGQNFLVMVDYAHTPDSIHSVLQAARPLTSGRVIVVFGCGGDRDRAKRPRMGLEATVAGRPHGADQRQPAIRGPPRDHRRDRGRGARGRRHAMRRSPIGRRRSSLRSLRPRPATSSSSPGRAMRPTRRWTGSRSISTTAPWPRAAIRPEGEPPMIPRLMSDVARAVDGLRTGDDAWVSSVAIDSRLVRPGGLFVALPGEHTDGGRFVRRGLRERRRRRAGTGRPPRGRPRGIACVPRTRRSSCLAADERRPIRRDRGRHHRGQREDLDQGHDRRRCSRPPCERTRARSRSTTRSGFP